VTYLGGSLLKRTIKEVEYFAEKIRKKQK